MNHGMGLKRITLGERSQRNLLQLKSFRAWEQHFYHFLDSGAWRCKGRIDNPQVPIQHKVLFIVGQDAPLKMLTKRYSSMVSWKP